MLQFLIITIIQLSDRYMEAASHNSGPWRHLKRCYVLCKNLRQHKRIVLFKTIWVYKLCCGLYTFFWGGVGWGGGGGKSWKLPDVEKVSAHFPPPLTTPPPSPPPSTQPQDKTIPQSGRNRSFIFYLLRYLATCCLHKV